MFRFLGIVIVIGTLSLCVAYLFGFVNFGAYLGLTPQGQQAVQNGEDSAVGAARSGVDAARGAAADALDALRDKVK